MHEARLSFSVREHRLLDADLANLACKMNLLEIKTTERCGGIILKLFVALID